MCFWQLMRMRWLLNAFERADLGCRTDTRKSPSTVATGTRADHTARTVPTGIQPEAR